MEYWSAGMTECRSVGAMGVPPNTPILQYSITPFSPNENGEAIASPREGLLGGSVGRCRGGFGQDVDAVAIFVEGDLAVHQCK